ncbi:MAG: HAMP domain-containing protein [Candidatus Krumholzibacteriota bacterium]|nr:HAMP domain-containing protein [Candidatus Krumholzibacteriota bacterium]
MRAAALAALLLLAAPARAAAPDSATTAGWARASESGLAAEASRLVGHLDEALAAMQAAHDRLAAACRETGPPADDPRAAFRWLEEHLGPEPQVLGLPLGAQLLRDGRVLAWAGWPLPEGAGGLPAIARRPRAALRALGVHQFLSVKDRLPAADLELIMDLPLARRGGAEGALPVLLGEESPWHVRLLPNPRAPASGDSTIAAWDASLQPLGDATGDLADGLQRRWRLRVGGDAVGELLIAGPAAGDYARARSADRLRNLGLIAFFNVLALGLWLRWRLGRRRPGGLPPAGRILLIGALVLALRWLLALANVPGGSFPGDPLWEPRAFALDVPGGLFASPGDFLLTALAALAILLLVLRPYLRPESGSATPPLDGDGAPLSTPATDAAGEDPPAGTLAAGALPLVLLGLAAPALGLAVALAFARLVMRNVDTRLLFAEGPGGATGVALAVGLFFALVFLLTLFLTPAQAAWRRLGMGRPLRWLLSLAPLALVAWLGGALPALALVLLLPVAWGFRRAAARLTGLLFQVFLLAVAVALLAQDATEIARAQTLRQWLADAAAGRERSARLWRSALVEERLLDLGQDEALRRALDGPGEPEPWTALALWRQTGLSDLGEEGGLRLYDARGKLLSRYQTAAASGLPEVARPARRADLPDLWLTVQRRHVRRAGEPLELVTGELLLREAGRVLGSLSLSLIEERGDLAAALAAGPWSPPSPLGAEAGVPGEEPALLARLEGERVIDSSAPTLLGEALPWPPPAETGRWERRRLGGRDFGVADLGGGWLAAVREEPVLERLLDLGLRLFLHLAILVALLGLDVLFSRVPLARRYVPPLMGPRGPGFQHKLLGAFLLVALVPTVLTGLIAGDQLRRQYDEASARNSLERLLAARGALESRVRQDAQELARSEYVVNFVTRDFPPTLRDIGSLERNQVMLFGPDGALLLDETLRDWDPSQADSFLAATPPERIVYEREGTGLYAGILLPLETWTGRERVAFTVYYRQTLGPATLDELAAVAGGDLCLYREGALLYSNRPLLFGLGYQPALLAPAVARALLLDEAPYRQGVGRAGGLRYGEAAAPLAAADGRPVAVLASLDFSGLAARRAATARGGAVVLGMIAFLMAMALGLGGFLAGRVFLPIRRLQLGTRRLAAGDLAYRLPDAGPDEIGELVRSFNAMAGGLQETRAVLDERQRFLESVLENVASGVLTIDGRGRVRAANGAARRLLGLPAGELLGRDLAALEARPPGDGLDAAPLFRFLREGGGAGTRVTGLRLSHPEGARSFRAAASALGEGQVAVFEDVSDLIRSQKLAAWGEMARQVAHEIKNPLTPIKLSAQHMERAWRDRKESFDAIFEDSVRTITEQVEILRRIAQEFSLFGRVPRVRCVPVDLAAAAREVVGSYAGALEADWSGEERLVVLADAEALRKVLLNLVENAREAMGGGGCLDLRLAASEGQGVLSLRDRGPGIPEDMLDRLYEPYFSTKTSGTGLGLAISAQLVEEMGGSLRHGNHPEEGAVARLALPLAPGTRPPAEG